MFRAIPDTVVIVSTIESTITMPFRDASDRRKVVGAQEGTGGRGIGGRRWVVTVITELVVTLRLTTQQPDQNQIQPL